MQPELRTRCHAAKPHGSLEFDGGASLFELSLGLLGVFLLGVLENRLRSAVDEGLGLGQTEVGDGANSLDDLDLLVTNGGEDDGELILLFLGRGSARSGGGDSGDRSGGFDVELLFEGLDEVGQLNEGHLAESFEEFILGELSHYGFLSIMALTGLLGCGQHLKFCCFPENTRLTPRGDGSQAAFSCLSRRASIVRTTFVGSALNR